MKALVHNRPCDVQVRNVREDFTSEEGEDLKLKSDWLRCAK